MSFLYSQIGAYLADREDIPQQQRTIMLERIRQRMESAGLDLRDRIGVEQLAGELNFYRGLYRDFIQMSLQYLERDCFDERSCINQEPYIVASLFSGGDFFTPINHDGFKILPADRSRELAREGLAKDTRFEFGETAVQMEGPPGFRFWMSTEADLLKRGVPQERINRFKDEKEKLPVFFIVNGLSSSARLPFLQDIQQMIQGLGVPVGVVECRVLPGQEGRPYIHSIDQRVQFLMDSMNHALPYVSREKAVFTGHSLGGTVCRDAMVDVPFEEPFLFRIGTSVPYSHDFPPTYAVDHGIFLGDDGEAPREYLEALSPENPGASHQIPPKVRQAFMFHAQDIFVRDTLYQYVEAQMGLVLRVGAPFSAENSLLEYGLPMMMARRNKVRADLIRALQKEGKEQHALQLRDVVAAHNFSDKRDRQKALSLIVSLVIPHLLRSQFLGQKIHFTREPYSMNPLSPHEESSLFL